VQPEAAYQAEARTPPPWRGEAIGAPTFDFKSTYGRV
jgi:hypothetical protein